MKHIYSSLTSVATILLVMALFLSRCDEDYAKKCHKSGDFCAGYIVGEFVSELTEGYKVGHFNNQDKQLALQVAETTDKPAKK